MGELTLDDIDIHSTDRLADVGYPWEAWDLLRDVAPVHWYERDDIEPFWAVTRYEDVHAVGADAETFINGGARLRLASIDDDEEMWRRFQRRVQLLGWDPDEVPDLVFMDRPRHTLFRLLSARRFTPAAMRRLEADLVRDAKRFTDEFVAKLEADGEADLVDDLAVKLPLATICGLMGLPTDDWERVHAWTEMIFTDEANMRWAEPGETYEDLRRRMSVELHAYLADLIDQRQANPTDDMASAVINAEIDGEPLTRQQLHGYLFLLIAAGNETTRNATTGGCVALLEHRGELARLSAEVGLVNPAVEEILRWVSPVIQFARTATKDTEIAGQRIRSGDTVGIYYPSANRDKRQFEDPYRFDVGRDPNFHIAFGHGVHFCLGANLARWELRAAFAELRDVLPRLELDGEPKRHGNLHLGAVANQKVRLTG